MKTIFVTGNDTDIGKTHLSRLLANGLLAAGKKVAYLKPVQCGVDQEGRSDVMRVEESARGMVATYNFFHFEEPIAPLAAAKLENRSIGSADFISAWKKFSAESDADVLVIEGAGGVAVPLDENGWDWADFAQMITSDMCLLVVGNRLGSINQTRLAQAYLEKKEIYPHILLNSNESVSEQVTKSNLEGLTASSPEGISHLEYGKDQLPQSLQAWLNKFI